MLVAVALILGCVLIVSCWVLVVYVLVLVFRDFGLVILIDCCVFACVMRLFVGFLGLCLLLIRIEFGDLYFVLGVCFLILRLVCFALDGCLAVLFGICLIVWLCCPGCLSW